MSAKNILNLGLFFLAIILGMIIYFTEEERTELERLTAIDSNTISTISISHNKNSTTIARQNKSQWQITQPVTIAANEFRINSLLKLLNAPVHRQYAITEIELHTIGLDKPHTSIQFNDIAIEFGITNPATSLRYVKSGNRIYTIEDVYFPLLSSHYSTLVSLKPLPENTVLDKLVLLNQTISRDEKGLWQSDADISADNINKTIEHWLHDQAFGVHQYLQREKLGEITIYPQNRKPVIFTITDTDPWLIIAREDIGLEYHFDIEAYDKLINPVESKK